MKLVVIQNNEPVTTSLAVAEGTEVEHKNVLELARTYIADLEAFGTLAFETRKSGGRPTEFALLNEQQATLLLTYMRNSEIVRNFKKTLVKEFFAMRKEAKTPKVSNPHTQALIEALITADRAEQEAKEAKAIALETQERQRITEGKLEDFATGAEHFSITAYNKLFLKNSISNNQANSDGRRISKLCKNQGIELGNAPHPVWGTINTYPKAMLDAYYHGELH